jgi:mannose-6-phosphate isomerase-like protein (cupin superfamily)
MPGIEEAVDAWGRYVNSIDDWEYVVEGIEPKIGGCGSVFELPGLPDRPGESFAIADMRSLDMSEPHYHRNGETEIYIVMSGIGKIAVGPDILYLSPDVRIVTPPDTIHITMPVKDLVLAVINIPPFNADNYVPVYPTQDDSVAQMIERLKAA